MHESHFTKTAPRAMSRRESLKFGAAAIVASVLLTAQADTKPQETIMIPAKARSAYGDAVRPFRVNFPQPALDTLRRRVRETIWPERETVADATQGVQLATMQALARHWSAGYDWRRVEARLNAVPNFLTEIDGLDIHFIHVRSPHKDALPMIVTHGWPARSSSSSRSSSRLSTPRRTEAAHRMHSTWWIPSLPGYGFSGKPTARVGIRSPSLRHGQS